MFPSTGETRTDRRTQSLHNMIHSVSIVTFMDGIDPHRADVLDSDLRCLIPEDCDRKQQRDI